MKNIFKASLVLLASYYVWHLQAQAAGTVTVVGNVTATAGVVTCIGSPGTVVGTITANCKASGVTVLDMTVTPQATPTSGTVISVQSGSDNVTGIFTKTGTTLNWDVAANGTHKTGSF